MVPFGTRELMGIVVEDKDVSPVHAEREIVEVVDSQPLFSKHLLEFARWMSTYYMAPHGETLRAFLPQGMMPQSSFTVELIHELSPPALVKLRTRAPRQADIVEELQQHDNERTIQQLQKALRVRSISSSLMSLQEVGIVRVTHVRKKSTGERLQKCVFLCLPKAELEAKVQEISGRASAQLQAVGVLSELGITSKKHARPLAELAKKGVSNATLAALNKKGIVAFCKLPLSAVQLTGTLHRQAERDAELTIEQQHAVDKILPSVHTPSFSPFLVHGVTGSGKTLVYMKIVEEVLKRGKQALVLVPEISLTPQLIDRFRNVFEVNIGVFHSSMTESERVSTWFRTLRGECPIVIGARSALFAPLPELGVIIVDEEHEPSFKQEHPSPRYHARDSAIVRAAMLKIPVILGSATPSMESLYNAHTGKYHLLEILHRADGAVLPSVELVNIAESMQKHEMHGPFTKQLIGRIEQTLNNKQHAIVLHNRRGYASRLECINTSCGHVTECPACSVALTVHRTTGTLRCHYCDYRRRVDTQCEKCGESTLRESGTGTQRIEEEMVEHLQDKFPQANIERMDLDTTRKRGAHRNMLERFKHGEIDILIGTQMVARGLDFEHVGLAAVVNADVQLHLTDFRASERTFQLMTQVAGRAGRSSETQGKVVIQTRVPRHHAMIATLEHNVELFYSDELMERKQLHYPPFYRFTKIELRSKESLQVEKHAQLFASLLPKNRKELIVQGPSTPSVEKLQGYFRKHIVVKSSKELDPNGKVLRHYVLHALNAWSDQAHSNVKMTIDIDALGTL